MLLRLGSMVGLALVFMACSVAVEPSPSAYPDGGAAVPTARLAIESATSMTLLFGEHSRFAVRYTEADGTPIAGANLVFAIEGRARDSTLVELAGLTDGDGHASGELVAGRTAAAFRIRVSAERAAPAYIDVAVSDSGFGGMRVATVYEGSREIAQRTIVIYASATCLKAAMLSETGDRMQTVADGATEATFFALPAGLRYAIVARGEGASGGTLAFGCVDGVAVMPDMEAHATVTLVDAPLDIRAVFGVDTRLDTTAPATTLSTTIRSSGDAPVVAARGDAPFMLDAVQRSLVAAGATAAADALARERSSGDMEARLAARLTETRTGPRAAVDWLADTVLTSSEVVSIVADLELSRSGTSLAATWTTRGASAVSGPRPLIVDIASLIPDRSADIVIAPIAGSDALALTRFQLGLPLGTFGGGVIDALAASMTATSATELLNETGGCVTLASWAADEPTISSACDGGCVLAACAQALDIVVASIDSGLLALDARRAYVKLGGTLTASDEDGDAIVERIAGDSLSGEWSDAAGTDRDALTARMTGWRSVDLP